MLPVGVRITGTLLLKATGVSTERRKRLLTMICIKSNVLHWNWSSPSKRQHSMKACINSMSLAKYNFKTKYASAQTDMRSDNKVCLHWPGEAIFAVILAHFPKSPVYTRHDFDAILGRFFTVISLNAISSVFDDLKPYPGRS